MRNQVVARRRKTIYVVSSVLLLVVAAFYFGGFFLTKNIEGKVAVVNQRIAGLESELRTREPGGKEIKAFSSRLVNMKTILKDHIYWSQVLTELERLVLPNVTVKTLKGGTENNLVTLEFNTPTIEAAADLVVSLQDVVDKNGTFFKGVTASSLSTVKDATDQTITTGFTTVLKLDVKPESFKNDGGPVKLDAAITPVVAEPAPTPAVTTPLTP